MMGHGLLGDRRSKETQWSQHKDNSDKAGLENATDAGNQRGGTATRESSGIWGQECHCRIGTEMTLNITRKCDQKNPRTLMKQASI